MLDSDFDKPRHPIQVVARRTGLTPDVLRAWEKRYGTVEPGRSGTGHRRYSDRDLEKLGLLARAVRAGRRIGDLAGVPLEDLRELVEEDELATGPGTRRLDGETETPAGFVDRALAAVEAMDGDGLRRALHEAGMELSGRDLREHVVAPLLTRVGHLWFEGKLRIAQEHLASSIVQSFLHTMRERSPLPASAPRILITTPSGQGHEFGALLAAATAHEAGWRVIYLGPSIPAEEVANTARRLDVAVVALSVIYPSNDPSVGDELRRLRSLLGDGVRILVGGQAAPNYDRDLRDIDAVRLDDLQALHEALAEHAS